jgi:hypothetical protein
MKHTRLTIASYEIALPFIRQHEYQWNVVTDDIENRAAVWIGAMDVHGDIVGVLGVRATGDKRFFINGLYAEQDYRFKPTFAGKRAIHALQQLLNKMPEQLAGRVVFWNYRMLKWAERHGFELFNVGDNSMYVYRAARELVCHS